MWVNREEGCRVSITMYHQRASSKKRGLSGGVNLPGVVFVWLLIAQELPLLLTAIQSPSATLPPIAEG